MKITTIIILVVLVWQAVGAIVQAAAKKQKEQAQRDRLKDLAASRAAGAQRSGPAATTTTTKTRAPQALSSPQARSQDLAGRRKAQLEELRRRRAEQVQAKVGSAPPRTGTTAAPAPVRLPSASRPKPGRQPIRAVGASIKAVQAAEDAERRRRVDAYQQDMASDAAKGRRVKLQEERELLARKAKTARAAATAEPDAYGHRVRGGSGLAITRRLRNPSALRELIVLREILDAPLALRGGY